MFRLASVLLVLLSVVAPALAQTPTPPLAAAPPPPFTGSVSAGLSLTGGNTTTSTFNVAFTAVYDPKTKNVVKAEGLFLHGISNGVLNVDRLALLGRDEYTLSPRAFLFGQVQYVRDRFKDISYLIAPTAGLGYKLVDAPATTLSADLGAGGVSEKDVGQQGNSRLAVTAGEKFAHKLSTAASISEAFTALWTARDFGDALYTLGAGLTFGLTTKLQFKVEALDTYKTRPPVPTIKKNDIASILALVYKF